MKGLILAALAILGLCLFSVDAQAGGGCANCVGGASTFAFQSQVFVPQVQAVPFGFVPQAQFVPVPFANVRGFNNTPVDVRRGAFGRTIIVEADGDVKTFNAFGRRIR